MNVEETITVHKLPGKGPLWARIQAQPIEWKLHWMLRIGVFMEFVGHGAFGLKTKAGWLAYFHVFGIPDEVAWSWMPIIGAIDIFCGLITLFSPRRVVLLHMAIWGAFTALLRPAAGEGWWEFFERSYNYGGPAVLLLVHGVGGNARSWFGALRTVPRFSIGQLQSCMWICRGIVALMLIGHGGFGVFLAKKNLLEFYLAAGLSASGIPLETWRAGIGFFEIGLGVAALASLRPGYFACICVWKLASEFLYILAGANGAWWEVCERGSSYMVPLATMSLLTYLLARNAARGIFSGFRPLSPDSANVALVLTHPHFP
jgi:hypothetical protein